MKINGLLLGDAMIPCAGFENAWKKYMDGCAEGAVAKNWVEDWGELQHRRLEVEKQGPEIEPCEPLVLEYGKNADVLMGLFIAVSSKVMEAMPKLRIVGVSRAGLENVNIPEATKRGILVFNVMGRNAHAVSDFAVGMMLAECRNIARAHYSIKSGEWRKTFSNTSIIPELNGKTVGLVGFGYIGSLVAKKLSGFDVNTIVYDPYADPQRIKDCGCTPVTIEELFKTADFVSMHARLTEDNKKMVSKQLIDTMKPTAYFVNTSRAGLVDTAALAAALKEGRIAGAAIDVFDTEPIAPDNPLFGLDNVTLTTHLAGTTADALTNSPFLLMEDVSTFLKTGKGRFIVNKEVLENPDFKAWYESV